jgi:hypothetical protein
MYHTLQALSSCTAKNQYRKFLTNFPNFHIHVSVSDIYMYIPTFGLAVMIQEICGLILGIYKSLTDT